MSEQKRATLVTIEDGEKVKNKSGNSVRLELKLFEPNADTFPEFNYQALLRAEKKKRKKITKLNGFTPGGGLSPDPFDNDDDVARIAKELEKKYGTNSSYAKKHSGRTAADYCDKGAGYDENDSFIDNTEAYDELIPDEIETDRGGFYINSGLLEFQQLPNYERPDDAQKMPKPRKRVLSSSSSSSDDEVEDRVKNGHNHEKKLKTGPVLDENKIKSPAPAPASAAAAVKVIEKKPPEVEKTVKTTTVKDMLRAKRDNMRMQEASKRDNETDTVELSSAPITSESSNESTALDMPNGTSSSSSTVKPEVKLPPQLNEDLMRNIILLKEMAKVSASLGKTTFFDSKVQEVLLKVEIATRAAGGHIRNQVYSHLEQHLPCSKQTLMLRAKKMRIQQEEAKISKAAAKLRKTVEEIMPNLMENYEKEYEKVKQLQSSMAIMGISEKENELKWPRKQFLWTESTRSLLNTVVNTCRAVFGALKSRKETVEDYVIDRLKTEVLPIWPQGWMKMEGLLKEMDWKISKQKTSIPASAAASFASNNSLTITPVSSTAPSSKPLPSVQNKVTITNVDGLVKNPLAIAKTTSATTTGLAPPPPPPQFPSGLSISLASSSASPVTTASVTPPVESLPPPKKSFDCSIGSIISSAPPPAPQTEEKIKPPASSEITSQPTNSSAASSSSSPSVIKVRSVEIVNSTIKEEKVKKPITPTTPSTTAATTPTVYEELSSSSTDTDSGSGSDSSDCEVVENTLEKKKKAGIVSKVFMPAPKPHPPPPSSSLPSTSNANTVINLSRDKDPPVLAAAAVANDNDIDVNQIMKELKELQELQQINSRTGGSYSSGGNKKPSEVSEYSKKSTKVKKRKATGFDGGGKSSEKEEVDESKDKKKKKQGK